MANGKPGAPLGNTNGSKGRPWTHAINRALAKRSKTEQHEELIAIAEALLDKAKDGDMVAIKEIGDRLDGKPMQAIERTDTKTITLIERRIVQVEDQRPPIEGQAVQVSEHSLTDIPADKDGPG